MGHEEPLLATAHTFAQPGAIQLECSGQAIIGFTNSIMVGDTTEPGAEIPLVMNTPSARATSRW